MPLSSPHWGLLDRCLKGLGHPFRPHDGSPVTYPKNASYLAWLGARQVGRYG
ncbi:hypothetical protein GCM10020001_098530 [Nonomuraea salmonea]